MRITALTEDTSEYNLPVEHGLSLYIETDKLKILFDTGQSDLFAKNAEKLGINLRSVDIAVISHGHYDHGGGLEKFLSINSKAPVYMSRYAFEEHYNGGRYIGLDKSLENSDRIIFTEGVTIISEGLTLFDLGSTKKFPSPGSIGLYMIKDGKAVPDDFRHEHYLLIEENGKRAFFSGCSHKGIINIESRLKPDVLIGGFHFSSLPLNNTLASYAQKLNLYNTIYYTCHCTGEKQYLFMKRYMKRLNYISTGKTIEI